MSWTVAILPLLAAIALIVLPGFAVSWCLRLRDFSGVALAPVFSTAVVGVAGIVGGWTGITWGPALYLGCTVAACLLVALSTKLRRTVTLSDAPGPARSWQWIPALLAVSAAAVLISWRLIQLFQHPENISQRFDNVFHLNAVRYILETGNASTLNLGSLNGSSGVAALYPAAWHSYVALISQVSGASIPISTNAFNMSFSAVAWPLGCILLVRHVVGWHPVGIIAAGVLSAGQLSFPYLLLVWGPLFPNALSLALLPAVVSVVVVLARLSTFQQRNSLSWWFALLLAIPAIGTAHTSSLNALIALTLPVLIVLGIRTGRVLRSQEACLGQYLKFAAIVIAVGGAFIMVWLKLRPGFYDHWGPHQTKSGAIGEALTNAPMNTPVAWGISILAVIGFVGAWRNSNQRWIPFSYAIVVTLYVVDASTPRGAVRDILTGAWYQDTNRLAALLPVVATLLASVGAVVIFRAAMNSQWTTGWSDVRDVDKRRLVPLLCLALSLVLAAVTQYGALRDYIGSSKDVYAFTAESPILSPDEALLLSRLPSIVPEDAVIAGNPWNGSSLAYAISDRKVLSYHLFSALTHGGSVITKGLATSADGSAVCAAAESENVRYVLDFGDYYLAANESSNSFPGVTSVEGSKRLSLVESVGTAKLFELTGCP